MENKKGCTKLTNPHVLLDSIDVFIFDCDGVIWRGEDLIDGVADTLRNLRELGKYVYFITNNSTKSRKACLKKFLSLGLDVSYEEILSSSFGAALYFQLNPLPMDKKVYVIGMQGILDELELHNIPYIGGPNDADKKVSFPPDCAMEYDRDVSAVVVGYDADINYYKIQYAQLCINNNPGCQFIATNLDQVKHLTSDQEWAGSGAMVGAIVGCTGRSPVVVGKPSSLLIDHLLQQFPTINRSRICMIGDRLDTDILFGNQNGLKSTLVLSGVTTLDQLHSPTNVILPDYYASSIADFFPIE